jgi:SAM-dependent methyltransferase/uncharacterized protein YbaR (Trm112 family)
MTLSVASSESKPVSDRLISLLICPACQKPVWLAAGDEVNGELRCPFGHRYPVIRGVPRMFVGGPTPELLAYHRDYFAKNPELSASWKPAGPHEHVKARTSQAFGFEWTEFSDYAADNYEKMLGPAMVHELEGKRVLEIGCGAGRHALRTASRGAEVVALDYSLAVESAIENTRGIDSVHVVQGDVYHLPFRKRQFDAAYSLGVLHHLPDPEEGFRQTVARVRPGGLAFIWVYKRTARKLLFEPVRRAFTYVPSKPLKRICYLAALLDYGVFCRLYRLSKNCGVVGTSVGRLFPNRIREYATYNFDVNYTDWYDRLSAPIVRVYTEQDIYRWFERHGFCEINITAHSDFGVRGCGRIAS